MVLPSCVANISSILSADTNFFRQIVVPAISLSHGFLLIFSMKIYLATSPFTTQIVAATGRMYNQSQMKLWEGFLWSYKNSFATTAFLAQKDRIFCRQGRNWFWRRLHMLLVHNSRTPMIAAYSHWVHYYTYWTVALTHRMPSLPSMLQVFVKAYTVN